MRALLVTHTVHYIGDEVYLHVTTMRAACSLLETHTEVPETLEAYHLSHGGYCTSLVGSPVHVLVFTVAFSDHSHLYRTSFLYYIVPVYCMVLYIYMYCITSTTRDTSTRRFEHFGHMAKTLV